MTRPTDDTPPEAPPEGANLDDEAPPLGSWEALYGLILAALAIQIVLYLLLTRWAS